MIIQTPPRILTPVPELDRLAEGTRLHRIHSARRKGETFNDSKEKTRFAPLSNDEGERIPILYAGATFDVAVYEGLFRTSRTWPASQLALVAHSVLVIGRTLGLVPLSPSNLIAWGLTEDIVSVPSRDQDLTRRLGEAVHRSIAEADGMAWVSNREGQDQCYLLFGDRVGERDLIVERRRDATDEGLFLDVRQSAHRGDITITL